MRSIVGIRSLSKGDYVLPEEKGVVFTLNAVSREFRTPASLFQMLRGNVPTVHAVREVSMSIMKGEVLGIIGESGSGKSTLGYLLANLETPSSGTISFHQQAIAGMTADEKRQFSRKVQVIFQDSSSSLNPRRLVSSAIRDALRLGGVPMDQRATKMIELAEMVGLSPGHLQSYPHELSGGQRQRIGIARALAMEPEVIVADEPVSALDVSLQGQLINLLMDLRRKLNLTIVLISHDLAVVRNVSDRVCVMFGGRLVECGIADELISNPKHPYTEELIASVPKGIPGNVRAAIVGQNDEEISLPPKDGCPYSNRCPKSMPQCKVTFPERTHATELHWVACHLYPPDAAPGKPAGGGSKLGVLAKAPIATADI